MSKRKPLKSASRFQTFIFIFLLRLIDNFDLRAKNGRSKIDPFPIARQKIMSENFQTSEGGMFDFDFAAQGHCYLRWLFLQLEKMFSATNYCH